MPTFTSSSAVAGELGVRQVDGQAADRDVVVSLDVRCDEWAERAVADRPVETDVDDGDRDRERREDDPDDDEPAGAPPEKRTGGDDGAGPDRARGERDRPRDVGTRRLEQRECARAGEQEAEHREEERGLPGARTSVPVSGAGSPSFPRRCAITIAAPPSRSSVHAKPLFGQKSACATSETTAIATRATPARSQGRSR